MLHIRNRYFLLLDAILLAVMPAVALSLRADTSAWTAQYAPALLAYIALALVAKLPLFYWFGLYRRYWRYASIDELSAIGLAVGLATLVLTALILAARFFEWPPLTWLPRSIPLIDGMLTLLVVGGTRFSVRARESARWVRVRNGKSGQGPSNQKRVLVVGAGDAGALLVREMRNSTRINLEPVGFVDDDERKQGVVIHGIPVLGTRPQIPALVAAYGIQEVVIAMPTASGKVIREIVALCEMARVPSRTMPGIHELLAGQVTINQLRNVDIEDLLRREPVQIDSQNVARMLTGLRVLVTGAGGSIGSELCRQIARCEPVRLTLLGHGENSLFNIEHELRQKWPQLMLDVVVADIRDEPRLRTVFKRVRPQVIFHAAAHKHVPLMEKNCEDAITNNVGGTRSLVELAERFEVERFILISSDKAVNSVSVMGATKQVAELIVQDAARRTGRPYVSVRFGNVLGSRGSVVHLFREQIARGGPVTVTHPDMRRYFMTIPEAVQLVLQAATLDLSEGQIFVLDMGEPIAIVDLANDLIELSGLEVGRDIEIVFIGLRPGEKLYEELLVEGENYRRTHYEKIFAVHNMHVPAGLEDRESFNARIDWLLQAAAAGKPDEIRRLLKELVPTYSPVEPVLEGRQTIAPDALAPIAPHLQL